MKTILFAALLAAAVPASAAPTYETYAKLYDRLLAGATAAQLEDVLPGLAANLKTADDVSARHWTDCTPFDELAKAYILPDAALDGLGIRHEVSSGVVHVPAGVMHTYGYLFSQLKTAYGLKGKRWIESRVDERLGLPARTFSPLPPQGEFASNVTAALLGLLGEKTSLPRAAKLKPAAKVAGFIEQRVTWKTADGGTQTASVFTHLVELKPLKDLETADAYLLVYSVVAGGKRRLVTAFPIEKGFAASIMKTPAAKSAAFSPRFNLYVDPNWMAVSQDNLGYKPRD
jgi:acyl-CoA synthetase (AMP-forming)/AMP-acid ligase II